MERAKRGLSTIDEIAALSGLSKATVNYYTNLGLLRIADKQGNKRLYDAEEVRQRLEKIRDLRRSGYSLRLICGQLATLP